jgi:hypothetical protein
MAAPLISQPLKTPTDHFHETSPNKYVKDLKPSIWSNERTITPSIPQSNSMASFFFNVPSFTSSSSSSSSLLSNAISNDTSLFNEDSNVTTTFGEIKSNQNSNCVIRRPITGSNNRYRHFPQPIIEENSISSLDLDNNSNNSKYLNWFAPLSSSVNNNKEYTSLLMPVNKSHCFLSSIKNKNKKDPFGPSTTNNLRTTNANLYLKQQQQKQNQLLNDYNFIKNYEQQQQQRFQEESRQSMIKSNTISSFSSFLS